MTDTLALLKGYFTDNAPAKATIAAGGVATASFTELFCGFNSSTALSCHIAASISDLLKILIGMMLLDLITGVLAARCDGARITSRRLGEGMKRKCAMLLVVAGSVLLEGVFRAQGIPTGHLLYKWTASWFCAVEALSLYENADRMGIPMPTFLKGSIEWLLQRANKKGAAVVAAAEVVPDLTTTTPPAPTGAS